MSGNGQTFFEKVAHRKDRERVWNTLIESRCEILVVDHKKQKIVAIPHSLSGPNLVLTAAQPERLPLANPCILNFSIGPEKYFMKADLNHRLGSAVTLDIHQDLFKLQRRDSFRLAFPPGFRAQISLTHRNSLELKMNCSLADLSGGGCAFEFNSSPDMTFKAGDIVSARLQVGKEFDEQVTGVVRHCRMVGSRGSGLCRVGLEFQNLKISKQEEIIRLVMDLHRELFSKMKV